MDRVRARARAVGLEVCLRKCEVYARNRPAVIPEDWAELRWVDWEEGVDVLGVPVGSEKFVGGVVGGVV